LTSQKVSGTTGSTLAFLPLRRRYLWLMSVTLLVAAVLRLAAVGQVPPGLYHDEAYNGLDALKILDGDFSLYFSANNGREPMFIYLIALWVGLLGRSPFAVRLASFAPGLLTIAATYAMARTLFSRRVGLMSAAVLGVTLWHVHLSRVGYRAVLLPLFIALTIWQGALGWRTGRRRYWLAAGALYGLSFYTYMAVRFTPVALFLFGLYCLLTRPGWRKRERLVPLAWAGLTFLLTLAPLILFTFLHPDLVLSRTGQVAIWNPEIHGGDLMGTLVTHTTRTLGMFFLKGDRIWRHNVPWRPVFDPLLGLFFLAGLARAVRGFRRDGALALVVIWTLTLMLPTLLAEDAPHFLRGAGVWPMAALFPALGMDWLMGQGWTVSSRQGWVSALRAGSVVLALLVGLFSTAAAYFGDYAHADQTAYWFESGAVELAADVNGFLGVGWDGERMQHGTPGERQVYIEPLLWENWTAVPFLTAESPTVKLLPLNRGWPAVESGPVAIFVWPYGNWKRVWPMLNAPAEIRVAEGALSQGDRDPQPFTTYRAFYVTPVDSVAPALARFQGGVELVGATMQRTNQGVRVALRWHATARLASEYTVFVHYIRDGQRIGQSDVQPANGHYPTSRWRAGDLINDDHFVTLADPLDVARDQIFVGLYRPDDSQRLDLLDQAGNPAGSFVALPISEILP